LRNMLFGDKKKKPEILFLASSDPAGTRTQGPYIKSVLLYQLSYGILLFASLYSKAGANILK